MVQRTYPLDVVLFRLLMPHLHPIYTIPQQNAPSLADKPFGRELSWIACLFTQVLPVPLLRRLVCFCERLMLNLRTQAWMGLRNPCGDLDATVWSHEGVVADFPVRFHVTFFLIFTTRVMHATGFCGRKDTVLSRELFAEPVRFPLIFFWHQHLALPSLRGHWLHLSQLYNIPLPIFTQAQRCVSQRSVIRQGGVFVCVWWRVRTSCWASSILHQ